MKNLTLLIVAICTSAVCLGQLKAEYSNGFDFKPTEENEPKLVLMDSYNIYLLSYINIDGQLSNHKVILRKFDQKNELIETYKLDFPKIDAGTLYNYVGSIEQPGGKKLVVFTESYSGKAEKQDLYMHVFDKDKGAFTTTLISSFAMESVNKKGVFDFNTAENNRYAGMINVKNSSRKEAVDNTVLMFDLNTLSLAWKKEVPLDSKNYERAITVTNSGKAVLLRASKGFSLNNFFTVVTADKAEDKLLGEEVQLHNPKSISIGDQEFILDCNHATKGLRRGDFGKFMLYDINAGKIVNNNNLDIFNNIKDVTKVQIRNVFVQNNEFHIFAEAKVKAGTRPVKANAFSTITFDEPFYKYGPAFLITMDFDGKIKSTLKLRTDYDALAELYLSFGIANVKGDYYLIGGGSNIYRISGDNNFQLPAERENINFPIFDRTPESNDRGNWKAVSQLFTYLPDSKKFVVARFYNNQLSFVSISNF